MIKRSKKSCCKFILFKIYPIENIISTYLNACKKYYFYLINLKNNYFPDNLTVILQIYYVVKVILKTQPDAQTIKMSLSDFMKAHQLTDYLMHKTSKILAILVNDICSQYETPQKNLTMTKNTCAKSLLVSQALIQISYHIRQINYRS